MRIAYVDIVFTDGSEIRIDPRAQEVLALDCTHASKPIPLEIFSKELDKWIYKRSARE